MFSRGTFGPQQHMFTMRCEPRIIAALTDLAKEVVEDVCEMLLFRFGQFVLKPSAFHLVLLGKRLLEGMPLGRIAIAGDTQIPFEPLDGRVGRERDRFIFEPQRPSAPTPSDGISRYDRPRA